MKRSDYRRFRHCPHARSKARGRNVPNRSMTMTSDTIAPCDPRRSFFGAALQRAAALGRGAARGYAALRSQARMRRELELLDHHAFRDLGVDRSELGSYYAEAFDGAEATRLRIAARQSAISWS